MNKIVQKIKDTLNSIFHSSKGFTLLELLVAVLIICILAGIALPQYRVSILRSEYANLKNVANSILKAEEIYYLGNNAYTDNFNNLDITVGTISEDGKQIYSINVDCEIFTLKYIDCNLTHNNSNLIFQYSLGLPNSSAVKQGVCSVFSTDTTDNLNKVCQLDTGKKEPYKCSNTFCQYEY